MVIISETYSDLDFNSSKFVDNQINILNPNSLNSAGSSTKRRIMQLEQMYAELERKNDEVEKDHANMERQKAETDRKNAEMERQNRELRTMIE